MAIILSINRRAEDCDPNAIHIGPTTIDLSAVDEAQRIALIRQKEAQIFRAYRKADSAAYSHQNARRSWRH